MIAQIRAEAKSLAPYDLIDNLADHLRHVINRISKAGDIQLAAIGIGHPVERHDAQSVTIAAPKELGGAILALIERLLCPLPRLTSDSKAHGP